MASEPPPSDPPRPGSGSTHISPLKAGLVLVGFAVVAAIFVAVGARPPVSADATNGTGTVTTLAPTGVTTTTLSGVTTTTLARSATSVQVANGSTGTDLATHYSTLLSAQGWALKPPADATSQVAVSSVYYASGQEAAALAIASEIGLKSTNVHPLTAAVPVTGAAGNDVVVVIGADLAAQNT
jgi:hypothetical protein